MGYKIVEIGIVKLHDTHVPYFGYTIVAGPKGGKYMLDCFNSEVLAHTVTNDVCRGLYGSIIMTRAGFKRERINTNVNDDTISELARTKGCKLLKRLQGKEKAELIAVKLDTVQKKRMNETAINYINEILHNQ